MLDATEQAGPEASLSDRFAAVRRRTVALASRLSAEDCQLQSMPDASPTKWHLAHTTWFFETFVLDGAPFDPDFGYLFNSYYNTVGAMHARPRRGMVSRPSLDQVLRYREWVDERMSGLLDGEVDTDTAFLVELGLAHEEQHQELILTDILHAFSLNPLRPAYGDEPPAGRFDGPLAFDRFPDGLVLVGAHDDGFAFDNERPRHRVWLDPFELAGRPVTNAEYRAFIEDDGYARPELWLSDGWARVQLDGWNRPLYWSEELDAEFTLAGMRPLDPLMPVRHVSQYEADAYARWAGARLPTEFEWETAAPRIGHVWEWTSSAYLAYPGFRPAAGSIGEYNGKFMSGQSVLRGASSLTAPGHARVTYRNFFPPSARWQRTGIRLARDA